jgi:hypothetical protein
MSCNCYNRGCADSSAGWSGFFGSLIVGLIFIFIFSLGRAYERVKAEKVQTIATASKSDQGTMVRAK